MSWTTDVIFQVNGDKKYQIHLKSESGPIYVLLVNQEQEHTQPLVVQVRTLHFVPAQLFYTLDMSFCCIELCFVS